jgi:preprotein translocase subunit SecD
LLKKDEEIKTQVNKKTQIKSITEELLNRLNDSYN